MFARSLRTLAVRVRAHNAGPVAVAQYLAAHPRVIRAMHPSLLAGPAAAIVPRQMFGSGMVSLVFDGDEAATSAVVDRLHLFAIAPSLGGVERLVTQPTTTTHHGSAPAERERRGIVGGLVRLSVGLEDPEDLIADLDQALVGASSPRTTASRGLRTGRR